ncbi:unnamed protein product, partial [Prunus brigantina]
SAALLSQSKVVGWWCSTCRSCKRYRNQVSSQLVAAIEWYSAYADDLETVTCFLLFNDMSDLPRKIQYPITKRLVKGHRAQSTSQYAIKCS